MMRPGPAALCDGTVWHRRLTPVDHHFEHPVSYVWLDPDAPQDVTAQHWLWSHRLPAPARFRLSDYGDGSHRPLGMCVRDLMARELGTRPSGAIRMLTQPRRWGWLFNPITVYLAWDDDPDAPVAIVLEVTNTPWRERHQYVAALHPLSHTAGTRFRTQVAKVLHVSPFLDERSEYVIEVVSDRGGRLTRLGIDVVRPDTHETVLETVIALDPQPVTRAALGRSLRRHLAPTHRVSAAIYIQAMRLWRRGVTFVPHPARRGER